MAEIATLEPWEIGDIPGEIWAHAYGHEGSYQVSNLGRVRSVDRVLVGRNGRKRRVRGIVLQPHFPKRPGYYPCVTLSGRTVNVHDIVGSTFFGPKPRHLVWRHIDDNPLNMRADNIGKGTQKQNLGDAIRKGRTCRGERNHKAKITEAAASAIKALSSVISQARLSRRFGISPCSVNDIHAERTWRHVPTVSHEDAMAVFRSYGMIVPHIEFPTTWDLVETHLEHHGTAAAIYYSTGSCYWSHQRGHAMARDPQTMKCPAGGQIVQEKDWRGWLETARENPDYYGAHGLRALLAAHHSNCRDPATGAAFAAASWKPYNLAIDAYDAEHVKLDGPKPKIDLTPKKRPAIIPGPRKGLRRG